ncbi:MoxR family ATPase [Histomonas meleagridis]|uniref:MoxR family ATPase n=1 Tax=Histomonas meleagridis TaxID=135588 RepID=UPI00355A10C6|nr:MoxR family ATPase [Histomonas meleagridis]KAH0801249.1 MoxR family ATPase [Histomonas meleagridis]
MCLPAKDVFKQLLDPLKEKYDATLRVAVSTFITAIKRDEHILISYSPDIKQNSICRFIEYISCALLPLSISTIELDGTVRHSGYKEKFFTKQPKSNPSKAPKETLSPFTENVCIVKNFDEIENDSIIKVMKELEFPVGEGSKSVPIPFLVVAIVPESVHLPRNTIAQFAFHINLKELNLKFPEIESPLYQSYDSLVQSTMIPVFTHYDITTYTSKLMLNVDCKPMLTSFLDVKTKLLLMKAVEDFAILNGRDFIIPDDVQSIFSVLVSHKFLLPGYTSFEACVAFANSILQVVPVPV